MFFRLSMNIAMKCGVSDSLRVVDSSLQEAVPAMYLSGNSKTQRKWSCLCIKE